MDCESGSVRGSFAFPNNPARGAVFALYVLCAGLLVSGGSIAAGAGPIQLTNDGRLKRDPVFVKGGEELVFVVQERPVLLRMMRMMLADRSVKPLHKDDNKSEFEPAFSPDGRYYAFVRSRSALRLGLIIRDTQENKESEYTLAEASGARSPTVSPDSTRVLYSFAEGGRQPIFSVNMQAGDRKKITDSTGINNWPSFSADGKQIAFGSTRDGNCEIYIMNADGSGIRRLTNSPRQDIRPALSPDGSRVAFTSSRDGNYEIYILTTDGFRLQRVTNHPERDDYPAWHPNGKQLVIMSERAGRHDLYLVDVP